MLLPLRFQLLQPAPTPPAPGETAEDPSSGHGRIRRARHAADFRPDWLPEALQPPQAPKRGKRARKRRERDLLMLS